MKTWLSPVGARPVGAGSILRSSTRSFAIVTCVPLSENVDWYWSADCFQSFPRHRLTIRAASSRSFIERCAQEYVTVIGQLSAHANSVSGLRPNPLGMSTKFNITARSPVLISTPHLNKSADGDRARNVSVSRRGDAISRSLTTSISFILPALPVSTTSVSLRQNSAPPQPQVALTSATQQN